MSVSQFYDSEPATSRVGYWDFNIGGDAPNSYTLDIESFVAETVRRMASIEEKITRKLVVDKLRELGYTVIEPEEES